MNYTFWQQLAPRKDVTLIVDPRRRQRLLVGMFSLLWMAIAARAWQLEAKWGDAYRAEALKPLRREVTLPAVRGRLLARDGSVLAADEQLQALAVHYRYLQASPDEAWVRNQARLRLPKPQRRDRVRVEAARIEFLAERESLNKRLAALCQLPPENWQARAARIERRIETMAAHVNQRNWQRFEARLATAAELPQTDRAPWWNVAANLPDAIRALGSPEAAEWEPIILKEQLDYHIVVENIPKPVAEEIRSQPARYPGVRIIEVPRRTYPQNMLAANLIGHLADGAGAIGLERQFEAELVGHEGQAIERTDRRGQLLSTDVVKPARHGADITLTIDPECQQTAEALLDRTLERNHRAQGGAAVLLDVSSGEVLALATAPRFNPNSFALADTEAIQTALTDPGKPLFDRAARMALPPGALIKPFVAVAMLESKRVPAQAPFHCEGYHRDPEGVRCAIYRQQGVGHGELTLTGALACNCNTYFLHYAGTLGADPLVQAANLFGFGRPTGIALPGESAGSLPRPTANDRPLAQRYRAGEAQLLAIGQGVVTVTPLQMACAMAALANNGQLVEPRLIADRASTSPLQINVRSQSLATVREALAKAVGDNDSDEVVTDLVAPISMTAIAGTGEVPGRAGDHAWCAGYLPADRPRFAFVIAIEHGGEGARVAAPIAKRFLDRLYERGHFSTSVAHR